jgi:hypothetical protein
MCHGGGNAHRLWQYLQMFLRKSTAVLTVTGSLDFVRRPEFYTPGLLPAPCEGGETPTLLGPLESANLSHRTLQIPHVEWPPPLLGSARVAFLAAPHERACCTATLPGHLNASDHAAASACVQVTEAKGNPRQRPRSDTERNGPISICPPPRVFLTTETFTALLTTFKRDISRAKRFH